MRVQVTLANGRGQGTYGLGDSTEEASLNALALWRMNMGSHAKPAKAAITKALDGKLSGPDATTNYDVTVSDIRRFARLA